MSFRSSFSFRRSTDHRGGDTVPGIEYNRYRGGHDQQSLHYPQTLAPVPPSRDYADRHREVYIPRPGFAAWDDPDYEPYESRTSPGPVISRSDPAPWHPAPLDRPPTARDDIRVLEVLERIRQEHYDANEFPYLDTVNPLDDLKAWDTLPPSYLRLLAEEHPIEPLEDIVNTNFPLGWRPGRQIRHRDASLEALIASENVELWEQFPEAENSLQSHHADTHESQIDPHEACAAIRGTDMTDITHDETHLEDGWPTDPVTEAQQIFDRQMRFLGPMREETAESAPYDMLLEQQQIYEQQLQQLDPFMPCPFG